MKIMFKIREIKDKRVWEGFLKEVKEKTFLQSFNWGEFNKIMGDKVFRLGVYRQEELIATALIIKVEARRGTFLFLPHGPNIKNKELQTSRSTPCNCHTINQTSRFAPCNYEAIKRIKNKVLEVLLNKLKEMAKEEKVTFIRIAPLWEKNEENIKIFRELGFRQAPIHIHPELTWELDITKTEEELLKNMRKTTRYLIRQALKNEGIEIIKNKDLKGIDEFNKLYQATRVRHGFVPFSLNYLENEFLSFSRDDEISIFLGRYKKELVSSGIFVFWQDIGFYHHGASFLKYPKIPVSYLLLWEAIREAKKRGCQKFNFWGIAPISNKKHPWAGLTLFKMGFGGKSREYVKTQDLIISNKYWISFFVEKIRKVKRAL